MSWRSVLLLPALLMAMWLLLSEALSAGQAVLGAALALFLYWAAGSLRPLHSRPKRPLAALRLVGVILLDIVKSNMSVAGIIWRNARREPRPGFMTIPLDMRDPHGLAMLACILTFVPGTVWAGLSEDYVLTLHVLDLEDQQEWTDIVKQRYERVLMEIFE